MAFEVWHGWDSRILPSLRLQYSSVSIPPPPLLTLSILACSLTIMFAASSPTVA
ncbi:hypothetical protein FIBSPDRAFT_858406 [Athelia psychrophila]|uniref:Uncharacterized protein n=1 Tax=Athelia psychrophila TaxID=1759441 RepID=A0A166LYE5_9AGAM|nr:hypothetical protein FIBSPDRAFT_858406 [Fibularhizoctonia sp. CBS 109695]